MKKKKAKDPMTIRRRKFVINVLEAQLKKGTKSFRLESTEISLTPKDVERIKKEISILKTRL